LQLLEEISGKVPDAIVDATRIPGGGSKRALALFDWFGLLTSFCKFGVSRWQV
jgi:hypothetical protein